MRYFVKACNFSAFHIFSKLLQVASRKSFKIKVWIEINNFFSKFISDLRRTCKQILGIFFQSSKVFGWQLLIFYFVLYILCQIIVIDNPLQIFDYID